MKDKKEHLNGKCFIFITSIFYYCQVDLNNKQQIWISKAVSDKRSIKLYP